MNLSTLGIYTMELWVPDEHGVLRFEDAWQSQNGTTIEGKNDLLEVYFADDTKTATWYVGLISNTGSPTLAEADTLASHGGWTEETSYSGDRKAWVDATAASKVKGTTTASAFTMSADKDIYGCFLCGAATGTSAKLFNTSAFSAVRSITNGSVLNVSYSIQM